MKTVKERVEERTVDLVTRRVVQCAMCGYQWETKVGRPAMCPGKGCPAPHQWDNPDYIPMKQRKKRRRGA